MKVTLEVKSCSQCPHKGIDGGPGGVSVCDHPSVGAYEIVLDPRKMYKEIHPSCPIREKYGN